MVEIQKKFKSFNSTQKAHGMQKMSIFHWKTNSQRKVELGEEYPSGPFLLLWVESHAHYIYLKTGNVDFQNQCIKLTSEVY